MPRPNNKHNKYQKHSVTSRANQAAAAAVPLVRATHQANAVYSTVPEVASFKPTSTQAVDASLYRVVLLQPSVSVSDTECHAPQPPKSLDNSTSIAATTKRCVRTVVYNTWSGYCHVPRHLKEPLRFETNVKQVAAESRKVSFFFVEEEEPALSLPAENITLSVGTRKEEPFRPQDMKQASIKTTLISAGSDVCEKAPDAKIVTRADENHSHEELSHLHKIPRSKNNILNQRRGKKIMLRTIKVSRILYRYLPQAKKVDETCAASPASLETSSAKILTTECEGHTHWELPKPIASLQDPTKQENVPVTSSGSAVGLKPLIVKIVTTAKIIAPKELSNCSTAQKGSTNESILSATSAGSTSIQKTINLKIAATVCGSQSSVTLQNSIASPMSQRQNHEARLKTANSAVVLETCDSRILTTCPKVSSPKEPLECLIQEQSSTLPSVCVSTSPKPQIVPSCKANLIKKQTGPPSPTAAQQEESKNSPASLPANKNKIDQSIATTPCATNTVTERIAPTKNTTEQRKCALVLADSAVDIGTLAMTDTAPKPKPRNASKKQSRGQKRASMAKAAKGMTVRQT
ncbi:hypothetical protein HDU78_009672 [Chytriomyces hyalinus]|nr:hypothetical protein HDU78_009672 [Chytriomyces hyalinus]